MFRLTVQAASGGLLLVRGHFLKRVRPLTGHGAGRNAGKLPGGSHSRCGNSMLMCYGRLEGYCACLWLGGRRQSRAVVGRELAGACVRSLRRAAGRQRAPDCWGGPLPGVSVMFALSAFIAPRLL